MSESETVVESLDHWPRKILSAIDQHNGDATSSEIREFLGAETTTQINYHVTEHLESRGLVETHQPESGPGPNAPKRYTLTERGAKAVEALAEEQTIHQDVAERIDRLEAQVDALRDENRDLRKQLESGTQSSSTDESGTDHDALQEQIANLAMEVEKLKEDPLFDETFRKELDNFRVGTLALTDFAMHELEEEEKIAELSSEYEEQIDHLVQQD